MDSFSLDFNNITITGEPTNITRPINAKERLESLLNQIEDNDLRQIMLNEFQTMLSDQQRLSTMLEQRFELLENETRELKVIIGDSQRRYEKAVREMQFFKKKYESLKNNTQHNFSHLTPSSSPLPPCLVSETTSSPYNPHQPQYWPTSPTTTVASSILSDVPATGRGRKTSNTAGSIFSTFSSGTEATSIYSSHHRSVYDDKKIAGMSQHQHHQSHPPLSSSYNFTRNPSMVSSYSTPSHAPSMISGASSIMSVPLPMTPVRSSISTIGNSMIQQKRTDPLTFGGSDALWDTISKNQGSDVTVEKIISNFLRRGGSPNTAKQSPSTNIVKYGYGMLHALIVTKAPGPIDTLLQQGANPNAVSIGQVDEEKVSPCYLAAAVGWLEGLEKLVQAGGDLMSARGGGSKKKTALHVAAANGNAAIVEYIVNMTQGVLNLEADMTGANALHYACVSGHKDLVCFVVRVCQVPVNEADFKGEIPLHWAARSGRIEIVSLLVEQYGSNVNAYVSKKVGTPYDLAKSAGHKKLADYLKNAGGLTAKKMDKKREEELSSTVPKHLESILTKNGFFMD
ncbi:ankyrin repeat-containing domain protein [Thamnidium elegans]|nr:ankyrin repeat-containing domain protein [Thamnidium elegans]